MFQTEEEEKLCDVAHKYMRAKRPLQAGRPKAEEVIVKSEDLEFKYSNPQGPQVREMNLLFRL